MENETAKKFKNVVEFIIPSLSAIFVLFGVQKDSKLYILIAAVVLFILIIIIFIPKIVSLVRFKKSKSDQKIIATSGVYFKQLEKLIDASEKSIKRINSDKKVHRIQKKNDKLIKKIKKTGSISIELVSIMNKELKEKDKTSGVVLSSESKVFTIKNILVEELIRLRRILLQLGQYKRRIKFGKYIINNAENVLDRLTGYIDFIGWTNILLGNNKEGIKSIKKAITIIENELNEDISSNRRFDLKMSLARAYRHLGTTFYTYEDLKYDVITNLNKANEIVKELESNYKDDKDKSVRIENMNFGVKNNIIFFKYQTAIETVQDRIEIYNEIVELIDRTNVCKKNQLECLLNKKSKDLDEIINTFDKVYLNNDNHRLVKLLSLKTKILNSLSGHEEDIKKLKSIKGLNLEYINQDLKNYHSVMNDDLNRVTKILDKNIYFDDAIETYVNNKIQNINDHISGIKSDFDIRGFLNYYDE